MAERSTSLPDSVGVRLPVDWVDFPLEDAEFKRFLERFVADVRDNGDVPRTQIRQTELFLVQARNVALSNRVIAASGFVDVENTDAAGLPVSGSMVVATLDRRSLDTDVPLLPEVLISSLSLDRGGSDSTGVVTDEIEPPSIVKIGDHTAVKAVRLVRSTSESATNHKMLVIMFLVSVNDGDGVVILQFATPNLELARDFEELFDKIAGTLRLMTPSDDTFDVSVES